MLETQVLKLNKNYQPIDIITVRDAFTKLYSNLAEVITVEDGAYCNYNFNSWIEASEYKEEFEKEVNDFIHTAYLSLAVPRVIRMFNYGKFHISDVKLTRRNIYARDNNTCQYCGKKFNISKLNIDHVVPRSLGGRNTWTNLVCSCFKCNQKKASKTLKQTNMKLIREPFKPSCSPQMTIHFGNKKYESWKHFVSETYWTRELED